MVFGRLFRSTPAEKPSQSEPSSDLADEHSRKDVPAFPPACQLPITSNSIVPSRDNAADKAAQTLFRIQEALDETRNAVPRPTPVADIPVAGSPTLTAAGAHVAANAFKARDISLYKSLLGGVYDGVLVLDAKGAVIASNRRAEQFLGYSEQELWGMQCEALIVGVNTRILYKLHAHAEEGRFSVVNGTCKRKDGSTFPAEVAISRIRLLNEGDLIFSIRNIERREKVREQRGLEEEAIRSTGAGIVVCGTDGLVEYANPAFLKLLALSDEQDVLKHMIGDFCSSYEQVNAMMHAPSSQGMWLGTLELVTPKGAKRDVLVSAALSQFHRGGAARIVLTMIPLPTAVR